MDGEMLFSDPLNDLNAMHEAEKVLTPEKEERYVGMLQNVMGIEVFEEGSRWESSHLSSSDSVYRATASQRAEAFLKTLGLWKGGES
jgi:hypothetical protein